ncbi:MAG TPA: adenylate/guanylate cyclase domain-containing protein [Casimicrobiaceae bacterium]|nr:adenylate/guanylate cyclase domain-containing protein [Casimicrobiaceae bacterium]
MTTSSTNVDGFESTVATVAFVDLAGFSALSDVYGDTSAIAVLTLFEQLVREALGPLGAPIKWIGDEAMFGFADPQAALGVLGRLLPACRSEPLLPLTRTGINHGPVLRRGSDLFGSTVNVAARIAAIASPGQLLATQPVATFATASGIVARGIGNVALRSIAEPVPLFAIEMAPVADAAWICPVCKMHAPFEAYVKAMPTGPWFCSERCAEAYVRSPQTYPVARKGAGGAPA